MPTYLMSQNMYNELTHVSGFTEMNGGTYPEYICIILDSQLTNDQKEKFKSKTTIAEAMNYLGTIVDYTHDYNLRTK